MRCLAAPWRGSKQPRAATTGSGAAAGAAGRGGGANTIQAKLTYAAPTTSAIVDQVPAFRLHQPRCARHRDDHRLERRAEPHAYGYRHVRRRR